MRARTVTAAAIFAFCTAFQTTSFDGCAGGPGPAVPVPASTDPTCVLDEDCPATACEDRRCIGGVCRVVALSRDGDGDGMSPPPCGDDCDDSNRDIRPGEPEACDGVDQDCDGVIDEAAPPAVIRRALPIAEDVIRAAALGDGIVVLETALGSGLSARFVSFDGLVGDPVSLGVGAEPILYDVAQTDDGAVAVLYDESANTIALLPMTIGPGGDPVPGARLDIVDVAGAPVLSALRAEALPITLPGGGRSRVLAVSWRDVTDATSLWADGLASPVSLAPSTPGSLAPDVATDGTYLVATRSTLDAVFLDPATGAEVTVQTLPGARWAMSPIASDDGRVIAVVQDAFDHALTAFTTTTATALRPAPATMPRGLPARIDSGPDFHLLTRFEDGSSTGTSGVWAVVIDPTSLESVRSFPRAEVSGIGGGPVLDFDVVVSESGAAVLSGFGFAGTTLTTFACRDGG